MQQRLAERCLRARHVILTAALLCAGCEADRPPPPTAFYDGLPISGSFADAQRAGFTNCSNADSERVRCRRSGVMLGGQGPYEAAIDLVESRGGFVELTLWHQQDQYAVYRIRDAMKGKGWRYCFTGTEHIGDQVVYTRKSTPVTISMDLSYWGKRRLRVIPNGSQRKASGCTPNRDLV